ARPTSTLVIVPSFWLRASSRQAAASISRRLGPVFAIARDAAERRSGAATDLTSALWSLEGAAHGGAGLYSLVLVSTNRSAPPATVTPVLVYPDVRAAVEWLEAAFGFGERVRIGDAHRAQLRVEPDGAVVVADVRGSQVAPSEGVVTQILKIRVRDVDAALARARDAGARVLDEPRT